jgi:hypothetical protein
MNRTEFSKSVGPGLFSFALDSFKPRSGEGELWREIVEACGSVKTSSRAYEEGAYYAGLGTIPNKPEGENIIYDDLIQGNTKRWNHKTYGLGVRITEELIEDSLYPDIPTEMEAFSRQLGASARETLTVIVLDAFNNGNNTTSHTAGDGLAIFSASHTLLRGGTWTNLLSPASDLSATSLQSALDGFENTRDDTGKIQMIQAKRILLNPSSAWKAKELLNSTYDPESPNNSINAIKERNLQIISTAYFNTPDAWVLLADPAVSNGGLVAFMRRKVTFARDGDFNTGDALFKVTFRFSVEVNKPNNMYYSAGA